MGNAAFFNILLPVRKNKKENKTVSGKSGESSFELIDAFLEKSPEEKTIAGHESFAAAEGAIGIAEKANKVRQKPLRVILNGLGKDAAQIISRINGFTFVETQYDYKAAKLNVV